MERTESLQNVNLPSRSCSQIQSCEVDDHVAQLLLEVHAGPPHGCLVERAAHRRRQPRHIGLQHVVIGAALQRVDGALLADGAGQEDERCVRRHLLRDFQRRDAIEAGQGEIGEDEIGFDFDERTPQYGFRIHALPCAGETACFELTDGDLRFRRHVFDENQSDRLHLSCVPAADRPGCPLSNQFASAPHSPRRVVSPVRRTDAQNIPAHVCAV